MAVYLIHFDEPISDKHTTQHYIGYADHVEARMRHHRNGTGARLTAVANERGISYSIVRIWPDGDRTLERKLKNRKNAPCLCPKCKEAALARKRASRFKRGQPHNEVAA